MKWLTEARRAYVYRVATAAVPIVVFYGLLAQNEAALWLGLVGTLLSTGTHALAAANTSTRRYGLPDDAERYPF